MMKVIISFGAGVVYGIVSTADTHTLGILGIILKKIFIR